MSGCLATQELVDFVEGRVDPPARARVEDHASQCGSCREVLSSLARTGPPDGPHAMSAVYVDRALAAGTQVGRYVISHPIGAGGIGVVYAARDPELDRVVAVKVLRSDSDPGMQARLRREAIAMAQLAHPNVVAVYDVGAFDDRTFVAMEYVPGETLARWTGGRSPRDILDAYCAAGAGLAAAHAAGIVHRDFKPENVLVRNDGRVHVGDFGLARTIGGDPANQADGEPATAGQPATAGDAPGLTALTAPGTLLGTPCYLAPELYRGLDADARSDQFSFCVALFTALYGERPFEGDSLELLRANVAAGRLREPRTAWRVPRRIRAALARGLAGDPDARFASLDALLAELAPPPRRIVRWTLALGVGLVLATALVARSLIEPDDQRCTGAAAAFAAAWNPERRAAIAAAFTALHAPYADDALVRVTGGLDRYAAHWTAAHTDACRATRIRGEQTEAMLELRMTCLERRRQIAAALVDALGTADTATVSSSVGAVLGLPDVAGCADVDALRQVVPPPTDPARRAQITVLTVRLAEARAQYETGAFARALELIRPIAAEARALAYRPFEAEVAIQQARIEHELGDMTAAEASTHAAIWSAEAGRHDEIAADAWANLLFIVGYDRADFARAESFVPRATAAIARLGGSPAFESTLERVLQAVAFHKGDTAAALAHAEQAVVLAERARGPDHLDVAKAINGLAITLVVRGETERGAQLLSRTLQLFERLLGPNHPTVSRALVNLGEAHALGWNYGAAEPVLRRGLAVREAALGPDHREMPYALLALSQVLRGLGRLDEALVYARRAVAVAERTVGPDDFMRAPPLAELGLVEATLERFAEADDHLRRALAIADKVLPAGNAERMSMAAALGDSLTLQSRWHDAARRYEAAIPALHSQPGNPERLAFATANLARIHVELGRPARALASLEQLANKLDAQPPQLRPLIELTLARALWDTGGDRQRACRLAGHARASATTIAGVSRRDLDAIERWLTSHRGC